MEIINQGLALMVYGISTVFIFLCLLIGLVTLMSSILKNFKDDAEVAENTSSNQPQMNASLIDSNILPILQAAVNEHRKRNLA